MWVVTHRSGCDPPPSRYQAEVDHEVNFVQVTKSKADGFMACLDKKAPQQELVSFNAARHHLEVGWNNQTISEIQAPEHLPKACAAWGEILILDRPVSSSAV